MLKSIVAGSWAFSANGDYTDYTNYQHDGFYIQSCTGLEPPKNTINMQDVNPYAGSYFSSARGQSRNIVLTLAMNGGVSGDIIESARSKLYGLFGTAPGVPITLRFEIGNYGDPIAQSKFYYIDAYTESIEDNRFSKSPTFTISLICPDPYFKFPTKSLSIPTGASSSFVVSESTVPVGFVFTGIPVTTGLTGKSGALTIKNGSSYSGSHIQYTLQLLDTTGRLGSLNPKTEISTEIGNKYAMSTSEDPTMPGFYLMPNIRITNAWPLLYPGENTLTFTLSGMLPGASFVYSDRKEGLSL